MPKTTKAQRIMPEFHAWGSMMQRCYNEKCRNYCDYGGRGIAVCERWRVGTGEKHPFVCFIEDMGRRPTKAHTIDRKDNDGNYVAANCRWATRKEQANNRRLRRNTVGVPGAQRCRDKFKAQINRDGRIVHLGVFATAQEASAAWMRAKQEMAA